MRCSARLGTGGARSTARRTYRTQLDGCPRTRHRPVQAAPASPCRWRQCSSSRQNCLLDCPAAN
eukprot:scaffold69718_cov27-Tisochrysis_lutea.AAC.6